MNKICCIYIATNKINNKQYVGQTTDYRARFRRHTIDNRFPFDRAIQKYGIENFEIHKIRLAPEELNYWERFYIESLNTQYPTGYNLTNGGNRGYCRSEETIKKLSGENHRWFRKQMPQKFRDAANNALVGNKNALGYKHTQDLKDRFSKLFSGENNPNYGKKHTPEAIEKIRLARIGKSPHNKGKHMWENRKHPRLGKKHSEETKRKLSLARREYYKRLKENE